jgi:spore coat protein CotF
MKEDFLDIRDAEGMPNLVDSTIALEFLLTAKTAVRNNAIALTKSTSDEVRSTIIQELQYSLNLHEEIYQLMIKKEWIFPKDISKQIELDINSAQRALNIADLKLFSNDTETLSLDELLFGVVRHLLFHI